MRILHFMTWVACHLADLCIKAGMAAFPIDIDQLFIDVYYYFHHSSKRNIGNLSMKPSLKLFLNIARPVG